MANDNFTQQVYQDYTNWLDDSRDWRLERDRKRKFYHGQQYSSSLSDKYEERGWVDIVINKIRPLLRNRVSMLVASKPQGKIYGVNKSQMSAAYALEELMDFHFYNSDGQIRMELVAMGSQREGIAYFIPAIDKMANYGMGEIRIYNETYENVFVKPTLRTWDFQDGRRILHSKLMDIDAFRMECPKDNGKFYTDDELQPFLHGFDVPQWIGKEKHAKEQDIGYAQGYSPETDKYIRLFDVYDRYYKNVRIFHSIPTNTIEILPDGYEMTAGDKELVHNKLARVVEAPVPRIKMTKMIANSSGNGKQIYSAELPIEYFPVIPVHDEMTGNSLSLGEVDYYAGLQEMLNQSTSLMVLHASLSSLFRIIVDENKIKDVNKFRKEFSVPGGVTSLPRDPVTGEFPIEVFKPEPINQAFWQMVLHWGAELEYESQMSPMSWGDSKEAPETFSATMQIHEWAQNALRLPLNHIEIAVQRLYEVMLQWSRSFYDYRTFETIRNDQPAEQFINAPIPMKAIQRDGTERMEQNDIRSLRARYRIKMGSTAPSQTMAYQAMYQQLALQYPVFLKSFVQYLDIPQDEKVELVQAVDVVGQQQSTIQEQQQAIQFLQKTIQKLQVQDVEHEKQHKLDDYEMKILRQFSKLESQVKSLMSDFAANKKIGEAEIKQRINAIGEKGETE